MIRRAVQDVVGPVKLTMSCLRADILSTLPRGSIVRTTFPVQAVSARP